MKGVLANFERVLYICKMAVEVVIISFLQGGDKANRLNQVMIFIHQTFAAKQPTDKMTWSFKAFLHM